MVALAAAADRSALPEYQVIPAARSGELTPAVGWPTRKSFRTWTRSHGGPASTRYSSLDQINRSNVGRLRVAWTYRSGDGPGNVQCNPIIVDGVMFAPTAGRDMVALDAATGREIWRVPFRLGGGLADVPARRGLLHWPGTSTAPARLLFAVKDGIYALHPATGKPIISFGDRGRVELPTGAAAGGAVWENVFVIPGYHGDVFGYDVVTGRLLWRFHTIAQPGEFGGDTWEGRETGANCWGGMALDEARGIAYISTASPKPNFIGGGHLGDNLFSDCVIALRAATGERLWHFQEVRHDIWNYDIPAPPNLVTVMREGRKVDAVAQVTKIGNTLLLDRVTGKPLFPFRLRRAPASTLPGEVTVLYQPDVELPEPFLEHVSDFQEAHMTTRTPEAHEFVRKLVEGSRHGTWFAPFDVGRPLLYYGENGGAGWAGSCFDPATGRLYVTANELPWLISIARSDDPPPLKPATAGEQVYRRDCAACHAPNLRGLGVAPPLLGLRHRMEEKELRAVLAQGRGAMPPALAMTDEERTRLIDFLLVRDRPLPPPDPDARPQYTHGSSRRFFDHEGYPGIKPPWGTLNCLDLNTGRLVWKVPLGRYPGLNDAPGPSAGTENYGGATVTAGGLVFCAGTKDATFRAFDAATGDELWSAPLPHDGSTPPAVYEVGGRQFVVVAAPGVRMLGGPTGDAWVAFALP